MFHVGRSGLFYFDLKAGMQLVSTLQVERVSYDEVIGFLMVVGWGDSAHSHATASQTCIRNH